VLINQCATPGLGSLMAGCYIAGAGQLLLSLAGAAFILVWFANVLKVAYTLMESTGEPDLRHWVGLTGFGLLFLAWGWAWISSVSILRRVNLDLQNRMNSAQNQSTPPPQPPKI